MIKLVTDFEGEAWLVRYMDGQVDKLQLKFISDGWSDGKLDFMPNVGHIKRYGRLLFWYVIISDFIISIYTVKNFIGTKWTWWLFWSLFIKMERRYVAYVQSTRPKIADSTFSLTTQFVNKYVYIYVNISLSRSGKTPSFIWQWSAVASGWYMKTNSRSSDRRMITSWKYRLSLRICWKTGNSPEDDFCYILLLLLVNSSFSQVLLRMPPDSYWFCLIQKDQFYLS